MAKEASLEDCLKLLKGDSDEQRLVGLLLATKFVKGDDTDAVRKVFDAIGFHFINRLLKTGSGQVGRGKERRQAYLHLALSILAAFCRLPELASSEETITKVPVFVTTLGSKQDEAAAEDCYECLLAVSVSSGRGMQSLLECDAVIVIAHQVHDSAPEAPWFPVALKLLHCILAKVAAENRIGEYAQDLAYVIPAVATQLAFRQDTVKFEAVSILYSLLVSDISIPTRVLGASVHQSQWPAHARTGLGQILHSRVAIEQKYLVLELAESIVELVGETWLFGSMELPGQEGQQAPSDRFFLLVVATVRVETAVLLNDIAHTAFGSGERTEAAETSKTAEAASLNRRRLMKCFALLERVITIVATQEESSTEIQQATLQKTLVALDEVVGIVLEFLEDAQRHRQSQGDILMASVRIVSRYLAEAPFAHQERCHKLLSFLLSVSSSGESRPFLAVQFMLPYLTQITLGPKGCKILTASGSHVQIVNFLSWAIFNTHEANSCLVDICDVLLNLLTKNFKLIDGISGGDFIPVIPALVAWVGQGLARMENAMAASVLTSVLTLTDEEHLRKSSEVGPGGLPNVLQLIISNLEQTLKVDRSDEQADEDDLLEIILSGLVACIDRYPSFKLELRARVQPIVGNRGLSQIQDVTTNPSLQQLLITILKN